ncbi:hypothetical protein OSB04_001941 [Centaurea solstitialis]|uniref:CCHC-type domain-containing protein n=1 Tax=Centaurea solstitialis TaxID=347529 RepID=A0AA38U3N2_9ASTR|nr:hypothetical protein OSB04_001941 [Centaurea solstitialis]
MVTTRRGNSTGSEEPDLRDLIGSEVQEVLQQLLPGLFAQMKDEILQAMDERMEAAFTARGSASGSNSQAQSRASTFKDFMACQPPHYEGRKDPVACHRWIAAVEGAFRTCSCPEGMKVFFAANLLRDAGKDWWGLILKSHTEEQITAMTWEAFKVLFEEQFSPRVERERIIAEFLNLKQTTESVNEITDQFLEKALFCPDYVGNEAMRMYRYRGVLKPEIREFVSPTTCTSFNAMVEAARNRELFLEELQQGKRKAEQSLVPARKFKGQRTDGKKVYSGCPKCGRNHQGECRLPGPVCYKCGKPGHKGRECGVAPKTCFHCFQPGHIKPNCPKLAEAAKAQVKAPSPATLRITDDPLKLFLVNKIGGGTVENRNHSTDRQLDHHGGGSAAAIDRTARRRLNRTPAVAGPARHQAVAKPPVLVVAVNGGGEKPRTTTGPRPNHQRGGDRWSPLVAIEPLRWPMDQTALGGVQRRWMVAMKPLLSLDDGVVAQLWLYRGEAVAETTEWWCHGCRRIETMVAVALWRYRRRTWESAKADRIVERYRRWWRESSR